ncbi:MAG: hypothetical protein ACK5PW_10090 [Burkholderiales bacterium]|jgi:hypothetical protein
MSPIRTVDVLSPPPSKNRLEAAKPQRAASIARTPVEQGLDALDAAVNNTVSSIKALPMQSKPRAYGRVAMFVSDLVRGIQASKAGPSQRDQWANALGTAIQARINALRERQDTPAPQESIMFLERALLEISTLQDANPAEPPAMPPPPVRPAPPPGTMVV